MPCRCGLRPLLDLLQSRNISSLLSTSCGLRPLLDLLQSPVRCQIADRAADCGRFSICYSASPVRRIGGSAADCGRFSICYSGRAPRTVSSTLRIAAASRFATVDPRFNSAPYGCGLRPLLDLLQYLGYWLHRVDRCGLRPLLDLLQFVPLVPLPPLRCGLRPLLDLLQWGFSDAQMAERCGLRPLLDLLQLPPCRSHIPARCGLRPLLDLLQSTAAFSTQKNAADCGRFSICYSQRPFQATPPMLRIAAASRFATVQRQRTTRSRGCGLRPLLDLLQ